VREPAEQGVRIDSSLVEGVDVGTTYDPMLSKVIAWGPDRDTALAKLDRALAANVVLGVGTNTAFLRALLKHPEVRAGRLDTGFIERELEALVAQETPVEAYAAAALAGLLRRHRTAVDPWDSADGWRLSGTGASVWRVAGPGGAPLQLVVTGDPASATLQVGDQQPVAAHAVQTPDGLLLTVDGRTTTALVAVDGATSWVHVLGGTYPIAELPPERQGAGAGAHDGDVRSPMPGAVIAVRVSAGDEVEKGDVLLVVEAMKMEHALTAPFAGTVDALQVRTGDQVAVDQLLASVTPAQQ
jgi:acetyl-CoA/propionyl-CoA carboxylase biotin carboxyl carrier protein